MARLELERLSKSYGQVDVVGGVSLAIEEGELVSLLGPSGCGKTTILRMVAGLLEPSGGTVRVAGKDITRTPVAKRDIGLVFQSYALFPHMTVFENVAFGLRRRGEKGGRLAERVTEALDMVQRVASEDSRCLDLIRSPLRIDDMRAPTYRAGPKVGEHNESIQREFGILPKQHEVVSEENDVDRGA